MGGIHWNIPYTFPKTIPHGWNTLKYTIHLEYPEISQNHTTWVECAEIDHTLIQKPNHLTESQILQSYKGYICKKWSLSREGSYHYKPLVNVIGIPYVIKWWTQLLFSDRAYDPGMYWMPGIKWRKCGITYVKRSFRSCSIHGDRVDLPISTSLLFQCNILVYVL